MRCRGNGRSGCWWERNNWASSQMPSPLRKDSAAAPSRALVVRTRADVFTPGDHASTFGGNPFACRAALTVAQEIERRKLLRNVRERGDQLRAGLETLLQNYPALFAGGQGLGAAFGVWCFATIATSRRNWPLLRSISNCWWWLQVRKCCAWCLRW